MAFQLLCLANLYTNFFIKTKHQQVLVTKSQEDAQCLITLIEGYYRLMVNQYVMLTRTPGKLNGVTD